MQTNSTSNMKILAVLVAAGIEVNLYRKPARPQTVLGEFPATREALQLIDDYESRNILPVAQKNVLQAYIDLGYQCKRIIMGGL